MKAFHLGAFEVMVVTDNRLSESGSLYQCWGFPEELTTHRVAIDGVCFMALEPPKATLCDKESEGEPVVLSDPCEWKDSVHLVFKLLLTLKLVNMFRGWAVSSEESKGKKNKFKKAQV